MRPFLLGIKMAKPQQHHPGVIDDLNAKMISQENLEALVEFRGQWYRVGDRQIVSSRSMHFFDTVVIINENHYSVVKDRHGNREGFQGIIDMIKMKLFAAGKTLDDLPKYSEDIRTAYGPLNLFMDHEGNLIASCKDSNYDPTN